MTEEGKRNDIFIREYYDVKGYLTFVNIIKKTFRNYMKGEFIIIWH